MTDETHIYVRLESWLIGHTYMCVLPHDSWDTQFRLSLFLRHASTHTFIHAHTRVHTQKSLFCSPRILFWSACLNVHAYLYVMYICMGWLRLVGSFKLYVSFTEYSLFYRTLLQKRPMISNLLIVATPYNGSYVCLFRPCSVTTYVCSLRMYVLYTLQVWMPSMYSNRGRCLLMYCVRRLCYEYVYHQCTVTVTMRCNHWAFLCVAVRCSLLYTYTVHMSGTVWYKRCSMLQCVVYVQCTCIRHCAIQSLCVAVCCSVLYMYNVHISGAVQYKHCVLQCVAVCCIRKMYIYQALWRI